MRIVLFSVEGLLQFTQVKNFMKNFLYYLKSVTCTTATQATTPAIFSKSKDFPFNKYLTIMIN